MDVEVEHFRDVGAQDANGEWDYFYEGDTFTFSPFPGSQREQILKARVYVDTPTRASFIEDRAKLNTSPLKDQAAEYLRERGVTEIHCLGGPAGYAVWWCSG